MEVLESALLAEFIGHIKSNLSVHSRVDLRQLVSKVAARLTKTVEELERLAGPGGDLDVFARVLSLDATSRSAATAAAEDDMDVDGAAAAAATEDEMDVDGRPAPGAPRHRQEEGSGRSCESAGSVPALLPSPGAKRKRVCGGSVGGGGEVDTVQPQKRRLLAWKRSHQRLSSGSRRVSSAPRKPAAAAALPRSRPARTVALAMSRIRRRIGKPTATRHRPEPSLGHHFSRITL